MKILFISDNFPPETNAAASRVFERAKFWVKKGHDVTFITCAPNFPQGKVFPGYKNKWYQTETMEGIKVIRVKTFMAPNKGFFLRIIDFLSFMFMAIIVGLFIKKADVYSATSPQFFAGYAGLILSKLKRRPFVLELGDLWPESIKGVSLMENSFIYKYLEKLELFMYKHSSYIIVQTPSFQKSLVSRGVLNSKISVIMNGVDTTFFKPQLNKNQELLQHYKLENKYVVGYIGTFGMAHSLTEALDVAKLLERENVVFMFVGDGAERETLVSYAKKHSISNALFIPPQKKEDIQKYWSLCDLSLVHLKNAAVFKGVVPSKIFESVAVRKPIILIAPEGEASSIITKHEIGIFSGSYSREKNADLINALLHEQDKKNKIIANMANTSELFSREKQADAVLEKLIQNVR